MIPWEAINEAALAAYPGLLSEWFPNGKIKGHEFLIGDLDGNPGESLSINIRTGQWSDFASYEKGGDPISLYAAKFHNGRQADAARDLGKKFGIEVNGAFQKNGSTVQITAKMDDWRPVMPVPREAPVPSLGQYDRLHSYTDADGELLFHVRRLEPNAFNHRKRFRPLTYGVLNGREGWFEKHPLSPRPLYGLYELAENPDKPVLVCEGEKATEAARRLFPDYVAVTWAAGSSNVASADWEPLKGRKVIIWPDNDEPGAKAAREIKERFPRAPVLDVSDLPPGGDAADLKVDDPIAWLKAKLKPIQAEVHPTPLPLLWFDQIEPVLDAKDFVQGVLVESGAAVIYGESNAGKTFFATDLSLHVAAGINWHDKRVEQGGVIYCVLEGGIGFKNRVAAWRNAHDLSNKPIPFAAIPSGMNLLDPEADTPRLIETIRIAQERMLVPVKLIVIDTLARAFAGGNENSSEDMGALVLNMDAIRAATGAMVLFVHHSGKDQAKGARGHSSLRAAIDTEIEVVASQDSELKNATVVKQRDMSKGATFAFTLDVVTLGQNRHGEDVTTCVVVPSRDNPGQSGTGAGRHLTPTAQIGLDMLCRALSKQGGVPPPTQDYPADVVVVPAEIWRREFYSGGKPGENPETKRRLFNRARDELLKKRVVCGFNDLVWLVSRSRQDEATS